MGAPKGDRDGKFTYADYLTWPDNERWELIEGIAYDMSPAPNTRHQSIITGFSLFFSPYFENRECAVFFAPFDVVLSDSQNDEEADTVVQPDLLVVCNPEALTEQACVGAPDLVVEVLSPSTAYKDMDEKLRLYERSGVREYWIVNPANQTVMVYASADQSAADQRDGTPASAAHRFRKPTLATQDEILESRIFPGLRVELARVFGQHGIRRAMGRG